MSYGSKFGFHLTLYAKSAVVQGRCERYGFRKSGVRFSVRTLSILLLGYAGVSELDVWKVRSGCRHSLPMISFAGFSQHPNSDSCSKIVPVVLLFDNLRLENIPTQCCLHFVRVMFAVWFVLNTNLLRPYQETIPGVHGDLLLLNTHHPMPTQILCR